jgi:hypothetical protein
VLTSLPSHAELSVWVSFMSTSISRSNIIFGTPLAILAPFSVFSLLRPELEHETVETAALRCPETISSFFLAVFSSLNASPSGEFFSSRVIQGLENQSHTGSDSRTTCKFCILQRAIGNLCRSRAATSVQHLLVCDIQYDICAGLIPP